MKTAGLKMGLLLNGDVFLSCVQLHGQQETASGQAGLAVSTDSGLFAVVFDSNSLCIEEFNIDVLLEFNCLKYSVADKFDFFQGHCFHHIFSLLSRFVLCFIITG